VIRLHLLGTLRLEADRAAAGRSVLSQPRRAALLAYLALRAPRGPERRDTLLGVFWPESDTNHARGALRSALHYLRGSLGRGVIQSRGSDEVHLDLDLLWCDAVEFDHLCDAGDPEAALRVYGGELLEGFFISEAPAFEHWLDGERARLRQRAVDAARALAAAAESEGEAGLAVVRLRRLLDLAPTDEPAARQLMRLLAASDDRGEAVRVFQELQARLETDYGLEPGAETRALAESLLTAAPDVPESEPAHSRAPPSRDALGPAPAATAPSPQPHARTGRRPATVLWIGLAAAVTLAVAVGIAVSRFPPAVGPGSVDLVAVLPFEYRGTAEHAYLGEGLADLLAANLNGAGTLQAVDPRALLPGVHGLEQPIVPAAGRRAAAAHGAGIFVLGSVTEAAGRLRITATMYGPDARGAAGATDVVVEGLADDVLGLVDRVSLGLLQGRGQAGLVQSALRTTSSVAALKSFLHGEAAMRRGEIHEAIDHYRRATAVDSTFALAHYRLSSAAYRMGIARLPAPAAAAAVRHAGRLLREDSLLVAAWYNHVSGSVSDAHRLYQEALVLRPSHVEALLQHGELLFHWGSLIGYPAADAREPLSRVLSAEPGNVDAALHLARIAARDGDPSEVDALIAVMRRADPDGAWVPEMEALRAFLSRDSAWQDSAIARTRGVPGRPRTVLESMAAHTSNMAAVERLVRRRIGVETAPAEQARLQLFLAHVRLGRGHYREAARGMAAASALPAARRAEYQAMIATLPFLPYERDELAGLRTMIAEYPDMAPGDDAGPFAGSGVEHPHILWPGMFRPLRLYLLGALHVRLGDIAAAGAVADSLAREAPGQPWAFPYERLTRARAAAAAGQTAAALRALGPVQPPPRGVFENFVEHGRPYERWLRAELLRASGLHAEALRWYATFPDPVARDLAFIAPAHLRRAEIHDAAGDLPQAAFHYGRFLELWADADAELKPMLDRARGRLHEIEVR
jgi:DNA-binding SARP family transcriptional activator/TolB-like protein